MNSAPFFATGLPTTALAVCSARWAVAFRAAERRGLGRGVACLPDADLSSVQIDSASSEAVDDRLGVCVRHFKDGLHPADVDATDVRAALAISDVDQVHELLWGEAVEAPDVHDELDHAGG